MRRLGTLWKLMNLPTPETSVKISCHGCPRHTDPHPVATPYAELPIPQCLASLFLLSVTSLPPSPPRAPVPFKLRSCPSCSLPSSGPRVASAHIQVPLWPREVRSLFSFSSHHSCFCFHLRNHPASFGLRIFAYTVWCLDFLPAYPYVVPSLCWGLHPEVCPGLLSLEAHLTLSLYALSIHGSWTSGAHFSPAAYHTWVSLAARQLLYPRSQDMACGSSCQWIGSCLEGKKDPAALSPFCPCANPGGFG